MPSHYLNQCRVIINWTFRNKVQWNFNQNTKLFIHKNAFENTVCETMAILSRRRWDNSGDEAKNTQPTMKQARCCYGDQWWCDSNLHKWKVINRSMSRTTIAIVISTRPDRRIMKLSFWSNCSNSICPISLPGISYYFCGGQHQDKPWGAYFICVWWLFCWLFCLAHFGMAGLGKQRNKALLWWLYFGQCWNRLTVKPLV